MAIRSGFYEPVTPTGSLPQVCSTLKLFLFAPKQMVLESLYTNSPFINHSPIHPGAGGAVLITEGKGARVCGDMEAGCWPGKLPVPYQPSCHLPYRRGWGEGSSTPNPRVGKTLMGMFPAAWGTLGTRQQFLAPPFWPQAFVWRGQGGEVAAS